MRSRPSTWSTSSAASSRLNARSSCRRSATLPLTRSRYRTNEGSTRPDQDVDPARQVFDQGPELVEEQRVGQDVGVVEDEGNGRRALEGGEDGGGEPAVGSVLVHPRGGPVVRSGTAGVGASARRSRVAKRPGSLSSGSAVSHRTLVRDGLPPTGTAGPSSRTRRRHHDGDAPLRWWVEQRDEAVAGHGDLGRLRWCEPGRATRLLEPG